MRRDNRLKAPLLIIFASLLLATEQETNRALFTNVNTFLPTVHYEMRYATENNFMGQRVDGYKMPICLLTHEAAEALKKVETNLEKEGYRLHIFDCYRPQRAVNDFVRWAKDLNDTKMKQRYYPHVKKKDLFRDGYIAAKSGHSRGSTVDLSIESLDMGTPFDYFDPRSHTDAKTITQKQHNNRMRLKKVMEENGFKNYAAEWWHYTLKDEPFKKHYFDFVIE